MRDQRYFLPIFLISLAIVLLLFLLGRIGALNFFTNLTQESFSPFAQLVHTTSISKDTSPIAQLQKENAMLSQELVQLKTLQSDNQALRDQFATPNPNPQKVLPAQVVGFDPENIVIHAGSADGVKKGMVVVVKNELLGSISEVSDHYAHVVLVSNKQMSFSVKDRNTNALGVAKGQDRSQMLMDNVLLSDVIQKDDLISTVGNQSVTGSGFPPDLVVGKIVSVNKNPSSLFQTASVVPLIAFDKLTMVFVLLQ